MTQPLINNPDICSLKKELIHDLKVIFRMGVYLKLDVASMLIGAAIIEIEEAGLKSPPSKQNVVTFSKRKK